MSTSLSAMCCRGRIPVPAACLGPDRHHASPPHPPPRQAVVRTGTSCGPEAAIGLAAVRRRQIDSTRPVALVSCLGDATWPGLSARSGRRQKHEGDPFAIRTFPGRPSIMEPGRGGGGPQQNFVHDEEPDRPAERYRGRACVIRFPPARIPCCGDRLVAAPPRQWFQPGLWKKNAERREC